MIATEPFITFLIASLVLCLAPGPDNLFVLTQSILYGFRSGLCVILGLCTGLIVHTLAVALGVAALLQTSALAFTMIKIIGALYLLYLAWQAFSASASTLESHQTCLTGVEFYRRGIMMNVTNPKVSLFFLAFLPQFIVLDTGAVALQIVLLGGIFIFATLIVFGGVAFLAGALGRWFARSPKTMIYLNWFAGVVLTILAIRLLQIN